MKFVLLLWLSVAEEADTNKDEQTMLSIVSKLPTLIPFLMAKVSTDQCKKDLRDFAQTMRELPKELEGTVDGMKKSICVVPTTCIQEVLDAIKQMVATGGMVEKIVRTFLESKGLDMDSVDFMLLGYLEMLCNNGGGGGGRQEL